jgi:hypothetical protein
MCVMFGNGANTAETPHPKEKIPIVHERNRRSTIQENRDRAGGKHAQAHIFYLKYLRTRVVWLLAQQKRVPTITFGVHFLITWS